MLKRVRFARSRFKKTYKTCTSRVQQVMMHLQRINRAFSRNESWTTIENLWVNTFV